MRCPVVPADGTGVLSEVSGEKHSLTYPPNPAPAGLGPSRLAERFKRLKYVSLNPAIVKYSFSNYQFAFSSLELEGE